MAALDLGTGVEQPFDCLIVQNRQAVQSMRGRWNGHWRETWSTVCSSVPHSQATKEVLPHLCKQERKRPTPVWRRLSRTQALFGRVTPRVGAIVRDENAESCGVVRPFRIPLVVRPVCRTYVVAAR